MKLLGDVDNKRLSEKIAQLLGVNCEYPEIVVFPDGEERVRILSGVVDEKVFIVKSLGPPVAEHVLEFCFLVDCARRNGAKETAGIIPYLGYSRADHLFTTGEAVPVEVVIRLIEAAGLQKVLLLDLHTIKIPEMFTIPLIHESAERLFVEKIQALCPDMRHLSIVSPDRGGIRRIKSLLSKLGISKHAIVYKERDLKTGDVSAEKVEGDVEKTCVIFDDMIATGKTIIKAADALLARGAERIYVCATHAILCGEAGRLLAKSPIIQKVVVTDTIPVAKDKKFDTLEIVSVAPIIARRVQNWLS